MRIMYVEFPSWTDGDTGTKWSGITPFHCHIGNKVTLLSVNTPYMAKFSPLVRQLKQLFGT